MVAVVEASATEAATAPAAASPTDKKDEEAEAEAGEEDAALQAVSRCMHCDWVGSECCNSRGIDKVDDGKQH